MAAPRRLVFGLALSLARPACGGELVLELRPDVLVRQPQLMLGELATVGADDAGIRRAFEGVVLGSAPLPGYVEQRSRAELEQALRGHALSQGQAIVWRGAATVKIRSESQLLDSAVLLAVAQRQLQQQLGDSDTRLEVRLASRQQDVAVPAGALDYRARLVDPSRWRARMAVWVDVVAQGAVCRSVVVPLSVSAYRSVYVARRAMAAGSQATADDFVSREQDVASLAQVPLAPGALANGGRLRHALAAGEVLMQQQMASADMLLRGDAVRLRLGGGGIEVETGAVAQADAGMGQLLPVRLIDSQQMVKAKVVAPGVVRLEER